MFYGMRESMTKTANSDEFVNDLIQVRPHGEVIA